MEYNYEYFQRDDVCRLCWNTTGTIAIFLKNNTDLANKVKECLDIDITDDFFSKKMCLKCFHQVKNYYVFKTFCRETEKKFQNIVQNYFKSSLEPIKELKTETKSNKEELDFFIGSVAQNWDNSDSDLKTRKNLKRIKKRTPTYCNICKIDLKENDNLVKHNSKHHGLENGLFQCFGCERKFTIRKNRRSHEENHCTGLKDGFKCDTCDRFLPNRRQYEAHTMNHQKNVSVDLPENIFMCKHCFKHFKTKEVLNKHILEHIREANYVCETCGRAFAKLGYLNTHTLTHTGKKQHACTHCSYRATQRSALLVHLRKHTGERPFSCDLCPQRCVSSSNLRVHRQRHFGGKKHKCKICGKTYGYKEALLEHACLTYEPEPKPCPFCTAEYTHKSALTKHIRKKHRQQRLQNTAKELKGTEQVQQHKEEVQHDMEQVQQDTKQCNKTT